MNQAPWSSLTDPQQFLAPDGSWRKESPEDNIADVQTLFKGLHIQDDTQDANNHRATTGTILNAAGDVIENRERRVEPGDDSQPHLMYQQQAREMTVKVSVIVMQSGATRSARFSIL